jgi:pyruvate/2-oxoglutarate dehydrogenase complex dihydrolipoamide dehydrogenase (E3) component
MAQALRRFGSRVTIVQRESQLLPREDRDVAEAVQTLFMDEGIELVLDADTRRVEGRSGERVRMWIRTPSGERWVEGSDLLVATGRTPNTRGIGLDRAGVTLNERGYIEVNDQLETTASGVWAMGECAGSAHFTHVSFDDFRVVRENLAGRSRTTRGRLIPYCAFIDPPLGRVGLSEHEARQKGISYRLARMPMSSVLRARALGETRGFLKALVEADNDGLLGFTMLGPDAGEVIAVVQTAMLGGLPYTALRDALFTHPTMAEGLNVLFSSPPSKAMDWGSGTRTTHAGGRLPPQ